QSPRRTRWCRATARAMATARGAWARAPKRPTAGGRDLPRRGRQVRYAMAPRSWRQRTNSQRDGQGRRARRLVGKPDAAGAPASLDNTVIVPTVLAQVSRPAFDPGVKMPVSAAATPKLLDIAALRAETPG